MCFDNWGHWNIIIFLCYCLKGLLLLKMLVTFWLAGPILLVQSSCLKAEHFSAILNIGKHQVISAAVFYQFNNRGNCVVKWSRDASFWWCNAAEHCVLITGWGEALLVYKVTEHFENIGDFLGLLFVFLEVFYGVGLQLIIVYIIN